MKAVLIGTTGLLGGRLQAQLQAEDGFNVLGVNRASVNSGNLSKNERFLDFNDSAALVHIFRDADVVIHLAGMNASQAAGASEVELSAYYSQTENLVTAAERAGVRRFIYLSTAHVYGSPLIGGIEESVEPRPAHPYSISHRRREEIVLGSASEDRSTMQRLVVRLSNAFGRPVSAKVNCWMLLANDLCRQGVTNKVLRLNSSGLQRRDFVPISEFCRAIMHLSVADLSEIRRDIFNVGAGWAPTVLEMTQLIQARFRDRFQTDVAIERHTGTENEEILPLDYSIQRLIDAGFTPRDMDAVNEEIDELIDFCLQQFS